MGRHRYWERAYQTVLDRWVAEKLAAPDGAVLYAPPPRTDADEIPVPNLRLRIQRPKERWERLNNREIRTVLERENGPDICSTGFCCVDLATGARATD